VEGILQPKVKMALRYRRVFWNPSNQSIRMHQAEVLAVLAQQKLLVLLADFLL
jgi:hypothetical protein